MTSDGPNRPRLALVLPHFEDELMLKGALQAIEAQTTSPDELVVVDDGSSAQSFGEAQSLLRHSPKARLIRHKANLGVSAACMSGLGAIESDYVAFVAANDLLDGKMVERAREGIAANPRTGISFSDPADMDNAGENRRVLPLAFSDSIRHFAPQEFRKLLRRSFFFLRTESVWFNAAALRAVGGFDPRLQWHADLFAAYSLAMWRGATYVPAALTYFRHSERSYSVTGRRSAEQTGVIAAWLRKTREPTQWDARDAFRAAAVLPDYSARALKALSSDPGFCTPFLLRRIATRMMWDAVRDHVPWGARRFLRRRLSSRSSGFPP